MIGKLKIADFYLIFDRYYDDSIKCLARFNRDTTASGVCHLTPIQSKDVILKLFEVKEQLIQLIFNDLVANAMLIFPHKLTTGKDTVLLQIFSGHVSC